MRAIFSFIPVFCLITYTQTLNVYAVSVVKQVQKLETNSIKELNIEMEQLEKSMLKLNTNLSKLNTNHDK